MAGIDAYCQSVDFVNSPIPLTNVKGAFSAVLGEFIALGMLWHSKHLPFFKKVQSECTWAQREVELVSDKTMVIIGFGDIGASCGKIIKAFGTKVIGLKRRPDQVTEEDRACADEILGMD
jgi:phosphoglycerate dehydrogenase-like enzyme